GLRLSARGSRAHRAGRRPARAEALTGRLRLEAKATSNRSGLAAANRPVACPGTSQPQPRSVGRLTWPAPHPPPPAGPTPAPPPPPAGPESPPAPTKTPVDPPAPVAVVGCGSPHWPFMQAAPPGHIAPLQASTQAPFTHTIPASQVLVSQPWSTHACVGLL